MNKNIKEIEFVLENCESVIIPYECFTKIHYELENDKIVLLDCLIKDNGNTTYSTTWLNNKTSPVHRLNQYNDITSVTIFYEDDTSESFYTSWYDDNPNKNKNQTSELVSYNEVHIKIEQYIQTYSIIELFDFPVDTEFEDNNGITYIIKEDAFGEYLNNVVTKELLEKKFIRK